LKSLKIDTISRADSQLSLNYPSHNVSIDETRSLIEYLYLDVKIRTPEEIEDLTDEKL
jgi:hypothetical protein